MGCGGTGEDRKNGHVARAVCGHKCPNKICKNCVPERTTITFNDFTWEELEKLMEVAERCETTMARALEEVIERAVRMFVRDSETGEEELLGWLDNWEGGGESR